MSGVAQAKPETVFEHLNKLCSISLFEELADENDWWASSYQFFQDVRHMPMPALSTKQQMWVSKIRNGLLDEAAK